MYEKFFKFTELPFSLTPDSQFFYNRYSHRLAMNTLLVALKHSEGFIKIVGEVGTGKTLLCRQLLARLGEEVICAYIPNPHLTPEELKSFVAAEIGAPFERGMPSYELTGAIYRRLLSHAAGGGQVVVIIDEAQAMPRETIEALRLLTNLETEKRKLLQVVLLGQPELDALLSRRDLRQLKQRIVFSETLRPFDRRGVSEYIDHRLAAAGGGPALFSMAARWLIVLGSGGIPRMINILAHKALLSAYGRGDSAVASYHVARAIADTAESSRCGKMMALRWHLLWPALGAVSAGCALALPQWLGGGWSGAEWFGG